MTIMLRDLDLETARKRLQNRILRDRGVVRDWHGGIDAYFTKLLRRIVVVRDEDPWHVTALEIVQFALVSALETLPVELGGTVAPVEGGYAALPANLLPTIPLVQALMVLRGHPMHRGYEAVLLRRPEQSQTVPETDVAPLLEQMFAANPQRWDVRVLEDIVLRGAKQYCADVEIEPDWDLDVIYPGSQVSDYMDVLAKAVILDGVSAFDSGFTRADALAGGWWLIQPVSPRVQLHFLAQEFGLHYLGILPPAHVDAPGRVVMACCPQVEMPDAQRIELLEDSKWVAGWTKAIWTKGRAPLRDPGFDLAELGEVPEEGSYGPYRHSSELPPWP